MGLGKTGELIVSVLEKINSSKKMNFITINLQKFSENSEYKEQYTMIKYRKNHSQKTIQTNVFDKENFKKLINGNEIIIILYDLNKDNYFHLIPTIKYLLRRRDIYFVIIGLTEGLNNEHILEAIELKSNRSMMILYDIKGTYYDNNNVDTNLVIHLNSVIEEINTFVSNNILKSKEELNKYISEIYYIDNNVLTLDENDKVVVDDKENYPILSSTLKGRIIKEYREKKNLYGSRLDAQCEVCSAFLYMSWDYDSVFCPRCNEWLEPKCDDLDCFFCSERPETPIF